MDKSTLGIITLVLVLAVIAGGWYLLSGGTGRLADVTANLQQEQQEDVETVPSTDDETALTAPFTPGTGQGPLRSILSRSSNYTCTFEFLDEGGKSNGTVYVTQQGKMRADFRRNDAASGKITDSHVIRTGGMVYTWTDGMTTGYKSVPDSTTSIPRSSGGGGFVGDDDTNVSWDCHAWLPDEKQFEIPYLISFIEA